MVGIGTALAGLGALSLFAAWRRPQWLEDRRLLLAVTCCIPLGFLAIEAGWVVTEVGRQPWILYGIMRTSEALTPVPGQVWHLLVFSSLYALLGASTLWMWSRQVRRSHQAPGPDPELAAWAGVSS